MSPGKGTEGIKHTGAITPDKGVGGLTGGEMVISFRVDLDGLKFSFQVGFNKGRVAEKGLYGAVTASESTILDGIDGAEITAHGFVRSDGTHPVDFS